MFPLVAEIYNTIQILKTVGTTFEKQMNSFRRQLYLSFVREEEMGGIWGKGVLSEDLALL